MLVPRGGQPGHLIVGTIGHEMIGVNIPRARVEEDLANSGGIWLGSGRRRVLIQVSSLVATFFRRRNLLPNQVIEKESAGGDILVSATVAQADEVLPIIRYWVPHVRILEPIAMQQQPEGGLASYLKASKSQPQ